jgi:hypothetical protein
LETVPRIVPLSVIATFPGESYYNRVISNSFDIPTSSASPSSTETIQQLSNQINKIDEILHQICF